MISGKMVVVKEEDLPSEENEEPPDDDEDDNKEEDYTLSVTLLDTETTEPIENGTVEVTFLQEWWPAEPTDESGTVYFDLPVEAGETVGLQASAAGYAPADMSIQMEDPPVDLTLEMEPEDSINDRSILTVNVVYADTTDPVALAEVRLSRNGGEVDTEHTVGDGIVHFSVEDGIEYSVSAADEAGNSGEDTITIDGDTEITLSIDSGEDDEEESSITIRLVDAETSEAIPDGTVTLHPNRTGHSWGPETTNEDGIVVFEDLGPFPSFDDDGPERLEVGSLEANAAGYEEVQQPLSWHPSDGSLDLTVKLEADEHDVERSVLTVNVVGVSAADYPEIPSVTVERDGETVAKERVDSDDQVRFSLEDGHEYTVYADGVAGEQTVAVEGDTEITLSGDNNIDQDDEEGESAGDTKTVWVFDPDSDGCSRRTISEDEYLDPAFATEEACLEYVDEHGQQWPPESEEEDGPEDDEPDESEDGEEENEEDEPEEDEGTPPADEGDEAEPDDNQEDNSEEEEVDFDSEQENGDNDESPANNEDDAAESEEEEPVDAGTSSEEEEVDEEEVDPE